MKTMKKLLIGAGIAVGAGILLVGIGFAALQNRPDNCYKEYTEKTYTAKESITSIRTILTYEDVKVEPADVSSIEVTYMEDAEDPLYTISEKNGELQIIRKSQLYFFYMPILYKDFFLGEPLCGNFLIKVPKDSVLSTDCSLTSGNFTIANLEITNLTLNGTSGMVTVENMTVRENILADTTSGEINLDKVNISGSFMGSTTSGNIELKNVTVDKKIDLDATSGKFSLYDVIIKDELSAQTTSGDISGKNVSTDTFTADTTSGDIQMNPLTIFKKIHLDTTSGNIKIGLADRMEHYKIIVDTTSGDTNLPDHYNKDGEKEICVSTTSGDIWFEFENAAK